MGVAVLWMRRQKPVWLAAFQWSCYNGCLMIFRINFFFFLCFVKISADSFLWQWMMLPLRTFRMSSFFFFSSANTDRLKVTVVRSEPEGKQLLTLQPVRFSFWRCATLRIIFERDCSSVCKNTWVGTNFKMLKALKDCKKKICDNSRIPSINVWRSITTRLRECFYYDFILVI